MHCAFSISDKAMPFLVISTGQFWILKNYGGVGPVFGGGARIRLLLGPKFKAQNNSTLLHNFYN